jgi:hypothetical protein
MFLSAVLVAPFFVGERNAEGFRSILEGKISFDEIQTVLYGLIFLTSFLPSLVRKFFDVPDGCV